ncbi:MAG: type II secretion system GspH family protein [Verrucomicrobiota bacterium]|nr:type II secretion system GspH family protein [Verrucomicrobiota bacterium]
MRRERAFTLVEIMIVVAIVALLAVIALPSFLRARERARQAKFLNALRIATGAFEMYAAEHGAYPPDVNRGIVPPGMQTYFGAKLDWTGPTPIGGNWDWDHDVFGIKAGVTVVVPNETPEQMAEIDAKIDDGDLTTGAFRDLGSGHYTSIIEE